MHIESTVRRQARRNRRKSGFTLVEMMLTVAIIGVLSAVAMPGFSFYVLSSKRTEATIQLGVLWDHQTVYFATHEQYSSDFDALGFTATDRVDANTVRGPRYEYVITQPWGPKSWFCSATANLDGDDWPDVVVTGVKPIDE